MKKANDIQRQVLCEIIAERIRQDIKWGEQNHPPQFWAGILGEEYGELCEAINETVFTPVYIDHTKPEKGGYDNIRKEAVHVAAVALGLIECLERNKSAWFGTEGIYT